MTPCRGIVVSLMAVALTVGSADTLAAQAKPTGEMVWAWHVSIAPTWFDPADTPPQITPFGFLYALHDALVRPLRRGSHGQQPGRVLDGEPGWAGV
jgi:peptide/nickel transport system substrate-binding protein